MAVRSKVARRKFGTTTYIVVCDRDDSDGIWWTVDGTDSEIEIHHADKPQNWAHFERNDHGVWEMNGSDSDYDDDMFQEIASKLNADGLPPWKDAKP